jgi:hypothetical protein
MSANRSVTTLCGHVGIMALLQMQLKGINQPVFYYPVNRATLSRG